MNAKERARLKEERRRGGFFKASNTVMRDPAISKNGKAVYALLCSYTGGKGHCFPAQTRLAADLGCSIGMIKLGLDELEDHGVIWRVRCTARGDSRNMYYLFDGFHAED